MVVRNFCSAVRNGYKFCNLVTDEADSMFFRKRRQLLRLVVFAVCGFVILYNEWIAYFMYSVHWPNMKCGEIKTLHPVLLVADPQILGEKTENFLARWDSDRYLAKTFALALRHVKPEILIFLGDLMDEGSIATHEQYSRYVSRFRYIFQLDFLSTNSTVFLPGDNDIGGEDEQVTPFKLSRFESNFNQSEVFNLGGIQIVKVNKMTHRVPRVLTHGEADVHTRIVVSHIPLLGRPNDFAAEVLTKLYPAIVFSAHDHKSVHFVGDLDTLERTLVGTLIKNKYAYYQPSWRFQNIKNKVNEVLVPTCSYRMGVLDMGYGAALIDSTGETFCYHILWLPSRFMYLLTYLVVLIIASIMLVVYLCCTCRQRSVPDYNKT